MRVIVKGVPIELPEAEANFLIRCGYAQPMELATLELEGRFAGIQTPPSQPQATGSKPRKSSRVSTQQDTKQRSQPTTESKARQPNGTASKSTRKG
jgi:hypothetical protein